MSTASQRAHGFTLAELLTAMAVISITLGMGIPAYATLRQSLADTTTFHELSTSFAFARMAAISKGVAVSMCPSDDGERCVGDRAWQRGWIVFEDKANLRRPAMRSDVIQHLPKLPHGIRAISSAGRPSVRYLPDGRSAGTNLRIEICNDARELRGAVVVSNAGRVRTERSPSGTPCPLH